MAYSKDEPARAPQYGSWGEEQIARCLDRYGVPFLYEHPLAVVDHGLTRIWYPDFQLRGDGMLIEYCGMPEKPGYAAGMARKAAVYRDNGFTAMMLTPDDLRGDWPGRILGRIEEVLADRVQSFWAGVAQSGGCSYSSRRAATHGQHNLRDRHRAATTDSYSA